LGAGCCRFKSCHPDYFQAKKLREKWIGADPQLGLRR